MSKLEVWIKSVAKSICCSLKTQNCRSRAFKTVKLKCLWKVPCAINYWWNIISPISKRGAIQDLGCLSIRPFIYHSVHHTICPSVIIWFPLKIFRPNFVYALVSTRSRLELLHIIFHTFVIQLWPWTDVRISFRVSSPLNIMLTNRQKFTIFYFSKT